MLKLAFGFLLATAVCSAGNITYNLDLSVGSGSVTGDIVTNGTLGVLNTNSDIVSFDLIVNDGSDGPFTLTNGNADVGSSGPFNMSATATQLSFNFGAASGDTLFEVNPGPGPYVCFESDSGCSGFGKGISLTSSSDFENQQYLDLTGNDVIGTAASPEPSTLALIGAGIGFIAGYRKRRG